MPLSKISVDEVKHIAELADAVRTARDEAVKIKAEALEEPPAARGEHVPTAALGLEPLSADHAGVVALREAITALPDEALSELSALFWTGRGEYAAGDWQQALATEAAQTRERAVGILMEEVDLHHFLMKGLYELRLI